MENDDGQINFSRYTSLELEESLISIDRSRYPENYAAAKSELAARKAKGDWLPLIDTPRPTLIFSDKGETKIEVKQLNNPFLEFFIFVWSIGWIVASASLLSALWFRTPIQSKNGTIYSHSEQIFITCFWCGFGLFLICIMLWQIYSKEILVLSTSFLESYFEVKRMRFRYKKISYLAINQINKHTFSYWRKGRKIDSLSLKIQCKGGEAYFLLRNMGTAELDRIHLELIKAARNSGINLHS